MRGLGIFGIVEEGTVAYNGMMANEVLCRLCGEDRKHDAKTGWYCPDCDRERLKRELAEMTAAKAHAEDRWDEAHRRRASSMVKKCEPNLCRFPDHKDRCYCGRYDLEKIKNVRYSAEHAPDNPGTAMVLIRELCDALLDYPRPDDDGAL
jgi:hypothetical protein